MFEQTPNPIQPMSNPQPSPLNPVMPAPGMSSAQVPPLAPVPPTAPMSPQVHTMPERFRTAGPGGSGPKGSSTTKKLVITLVVVTVVAGLGVAGLFLFNKFVKTNTNNANTNTVVNTVLNRNTNLNTNTVLNLNTTINTNSVNNTNAVVNATVNANLNTNSVLNTNTAANVNTVSNTNTTVATTPLPSSTDTDGDGLTDVEEAVYTTDASNPDTDSDTFIDGMKVQTDGTMIGELASLYNPKGAGGLETSGLAKKIENSTNNFSLLVPTTWTTNESSSILVITPTTQTGEFFQVRTYDNSTNTAPSAWYQTYVPQGGTPTSAAINGLETMRTADHSTIYFFKGTKVYGLSYTTTGLSQVNYWTTMMMMMKSFKLVAG